MGPSLYADITESEITIVGIKNYFKALIGLSHLDQQKILGKNF